MNTIYVLGHGQLGRMLAQAGSCLGIEVVLLPLSGESPLLPREAKITAEIEHWPQSDMVTACQQHEFFFNKDVIQQIADRYQQKKQLDALDLPTTPWCLLENAHTHLPWPYVVVKRRLGGYDGRGQWLLASHELQQLPDDVFGQSIAEEKVDFDCERSLIGVRSQTGEIIFFPSTENMHQQGILYASWVGASTQADFDPRAQALLGRLMHTLNYVGVMAMECFVCGDHILINELAPRVHNSGHWTQLGASNSQFEMHLRALLGWPLGQPQWLAPTLMLNLIGLEPNPNWLAVPGVQLHWYEKDVRPGRKVGHLNLSGRLPQLRDSLQQLEPLFPESYQPVWHWLAQKITTC